MLDERELQVYPIVQESVVHNTRTISNIRSLTSSLFGIAAGALGLESYPGFAFYLVGSLFVSVLIWILRADGLSPGRSTYTAVINGLGSQGQSGKAVEDKKQMTTIRRNLYFFRPLSELWIGDLMSGLSGFVLTWTLVYGLVKA